MMLPPSFIRIGFKGARHFGCWIPLVLLWPFLLLIFLLALVGTVIADVVTFLVGARFHSYTLLLFGCLGLFDALRGLTVFVDTADANIDIRVV